MQIHDPPMEFKDADAADQWQKGLANNLDPYGNACYRYASEWATLMERGMLNVVEDNRPAWIADNASRLSREADTEGITGYMYGVAVSMLSSVWKWGEILRRWHNLDTQIGIEGEKANESGGVLNPAVMNFGTEE